MTPRTREEMRVSVELWEADEYVVTVNGKPVGATRPRRDAHVIAEWLRTALPRLSAMRATGLHEEDPS